MNTNYSFFFYKDKSGFFGFYRNSRDERSLRTPCLLSIYAMCENECQEEKHCVKIPKNSFFQAIIILQDEKEFNEY